MLSWHQTPWPSSEQVDCEVQESDGRPQTANEAYLYVKPWSVNCSLAYFSCMNCTILEYKAVEKRASDFIIRSGRFCCNLTVWLSAALALFAQVIGPTRLCLWFQFGNTCYCNSVLQALYYCKPFRDMVLLYKQQTKNQKKETLLTCLADLFYSIAMQKRKTGSIAPKKFIQRLRKENCELTVCVIF